MSRNTIVGTIVLTLVASSASLVPAQDLPKRKPGLWQQRVTTIGAPIPATSMTMCTDERLDKSLVDQSQGQSQCKQQSLRREGSGFALDVICTQQGTTVHTKGRFSGDFNSSYVGELHSTFDPPKQGIKEMQQKIEARWIGPCKPGQKPGDVNVEGMGAMNMQQMMQGMDPQKLQGMDPQKLQEMMQQMQQQRGK
jgi:hypothetical protein